MIKIGIHFFLIVLIACLSSCATNPPAEPKLTKSKNLAILSDPELKKDFRTLKTAAMDAQLYTRNGKTYIIEQDIQKLNALTATLVNRLQYNYHLNPKRNKIHTCIGKNEYNSCYQYYNSLEKNSVGKTCHEFRRGFADCQLCNALVKKIKSGKRIVHFHWWNDEETSALVDAIKLRNGDSAYVELSLSSNQ